MTSEDVLNEQLKQIRDNKETLLNMKSQERKSDKQHLNHFLNSVRYQEYNKKKAINNLTQDFKLTNDIQVFANMRRTMQHKDSKDTERINFFPFTHGDAIEATRVEQKKEERLALKRKLAMTQKGSRRERGNRCLYKQGTPNISLNSSIDQSKRHKHGYFKDLMKIESVSGRVPIKYITAYPTFMKPAKHYPYRRLNDTHIEQTMQSALKKVEDDINEREMRATLDANEFK